MKEYFTDAQLVRLVMGIKGYDKEQMKKEMGVSRQTIYAWLYGKQRIADHRKPILENIIYEFIQSNKRFKPSRPITEQVADKE